jgi:hypothetical protein
VSQSLDRRALLRSLIAAPTAAALARCARPSPNNADATRAVASSSGGFALPRWPQPRSRASSEFWQRWGDGKAEMIGYEAVTPRYGHLRAAEVALVYVTEPFSRRTLIKDDEAQGADRMDVIKLNFSEKFLTGVYPYSVLTSVFCPTDQYARARFSPAKIALSAQEWCGHVYLGVWPDEGSFVLRGMSYFASEGDVDQRVECATNTLYEDALMIQLRELDGPFNEGREWEGSLVPALWRNRRAHQPLAAEPARIRRSDLDANTTRFVLEAGAFRKQFDVEKSGDKRVIAWQSSDGARARILRSTRMPYWSLHDPGDEVRRAEFGLDGTRQPAIDEDGGGRVGF